MLSRTYSQKSRDGELTGLQLNQLNSQEAEVLELPFTEEEIHFALMEMKRDKSFRPGWVHNDILASLLGFCEGGG